ncbi:MAG: hypothetical protein ACD_16C00066G0012 [uncultured bacterium]|nr:MAG: hypothetical protein ACD_16C00066G0012 [uncultured bacterium]OFW68943.1 MAG: hypothetical protein A2X70_06930 [Alphaproteobacteria bacterium GWC2_42_16]OFW73777.1 MAG: hypothetical protein A2Z80_03155 [Alphaproteobacteria bacterium GWA2_41_27]OFW82038.1 MAG: hypothetical protein A3E50_01420 [Alphaproteobacteria bacterium RIFCSPHIGHO2_12_FULL_42_100]OFW85795.1 MAG: hypothetical protein A2W06_02800 [Alphaproteobacteria bacterium RBG_16_42_14]OFW91182.1 MAG: hypothetical protein A3C41_069
MKINFPALFQTPLEKYQFFFIYGNDKEVFERTLVYLQKKLDASLTHKSEEDIQKGLKAEKSLFEENCPQLTFVPQVTDKVIECLESFKDEVAIFTSESARAHSKLVTYFAGSSTSLAIAAYAAPLSSLEFEFLAREINLSASFKANLFKTFQNDYRGLLSTLDKIKLYGEVQEEDFSLFLEPSLLSDDTTQIVHAFLLKNVKEALRAFPRINPAELIPLLRGLGRSFQTLFNLLVLKETSSVLPWMKMTPPVFFKEQPLYERALRMWKAKEITRLLETLLALEEQVKFSNMGAALLQRRLLHCLKN